MEKQSSLAKASKSLMLSEPFYGLFLIMLNKRWDERVNTAQVCIKNIGYELSLNESFWGTLTPDHHIGLLKHEVMHIAFFHLTDFSHLTNQNIANIAHDLEINQYIDSKILPPGGMTLDLFKELTLEPKKGSLYYYDKLMQGAKDKSCPNLNSLLDAMSKKNTIFDLSNGGIGNVPDHSSWKSEVDKMTDVEKKLLNAQTSHLLKEVADQVAKSRGTVPGELAEILKKITHLEPPIFDWRGYIRRFVGGSSRVEIKVKRNKPNYRFEDNPGLKIKPKRRILVAIDTSGSVSTKELNEFLHQIHHINKTGVDVTIIQCDTAIKSIGKFNPQQQFQVNGRGGTSFHPVTDYYDENRSKYNCLIYLTDGEAPAPGKCRGPVLWVISTQGTINKDLKGLQIKMN